LPRQHLLRETRPLARRLKPNALDKPPLQCAAVRENPACGAHARARVPLPARWRPIASISSMKMMQGAFFLACAKRSRTRLAPTPTNI
jgi:hypothetical protein